jgi:hypothetical protein
MSLAGLQNIYHVLQDWKDLNWTNDLHPRFPNFADNQVIEICSLVSFWSSSKSRCNTVAGTERRF